MSEGIFEQSDDRSWASCTHIKYKNCRDFWFHDVVHVSSPLCPQTLLHLPTPKEAMRSANADGIDVGSATSHSGQPIWF